MTPPIALTQTQTQKATLKQMQRLIMSPQMQQALHLLQLPVMELSTLLETEFEQNPILENTSEGEQPVEDPTTADEVAEEDPEKSLSFSDRDLEILQRLDDDFRDLFNESQPFNGRNRDDDKLRTFLDSTICSEESLFDHLMTQAQETFSDPEDRRMAEAVIGNLDGNGLLTIPLEEIAQLNQFSLARLVPLLEQIQAFDPYGVGGKDLQQTLLIQLRNQGKEGSLAFQVVEKHFKDLLANHLPHIKKSLGCSMETLNQAIQEDIAKLDLHPGTTYSHEPVQQLVPDVTIKLEDDHLQVYVNDEHLPQFHINRKYLRMLRDENAQPEEKEFIRSKLGSAKWLIRNIYQRNDTLLRIGQGLAKKQKQFFMEPNGKLEPLIMKTLADELEIHESTVARAVANKYVDCPRGLLPLRAFFTNGYETAGGEISSSTVREVLVELIHAEDKSKPLSDEALVKLIKARGIDCARRTVAKYRTLLKIGNAHQRRQWKRD